jgi:hypothetical protein
MEKNDRIKEFFSAAYLNANYSEELLFGICTDGGEVYAEMYTRS